MTDNLSYCKFTKRNPKHCLQNLNYGMAKGFFTWTCTQKTGVGGRRLQGLKSANSLKQYWKFFREVYWRETKNRIEDVLKRKMANVCRSILEDFLAYFLTI
jgi:hypothetical protein